LDVSRGFTGSCEGELDFRLDCGLGQLASLKELTWLKLSKPVLRSVIKMQRLGMEDVEWMVNNWKKLKEVQGELNSTRSIEAELRNMFASHGICTLR